MEKSLTERLTQFLEELEVPGGRLDDLAKSILHWMAEEYDREIKRALG